MPDVSAEYKMADLTANREVYIAQRDEEYLIIVRETL